MKDFEYWLENQKPNTEIKKGLDPIILDDMDELDFDFVEIWEELGISPNDAWYPPEDCIPFDWD